MNDIILAKEKLKEGYSCVLVNNNDIITSLETGISPLMIMIEKGLNLSGYSLADKIVGKAIALIVIYTKIKCVHAEVISLSAKEILEKEGIPYTYDVLTDKIINRKKTGICPMEETVSNINDPKKAYEVLKSKLKKIGNS